MKDNYYQTRINQAVKLISQHLDEEIRIKDLAQEAGFSAFHFQRIYKAITSETPHETVLRLRLEKGAFLLKRHPQLRVQDIAMESGFGSVENFSRQFKKRYHITPGQLQKDPALQNSRIYQESTSKDFHLAYEQGRERALPGFEVTLEKLPEVTVAMTRAVFGQDGSALLSAYEVLMKWFESHGGTRLGSRRFGMSVDDPEVTPANLYRYDFAVAMSADFEEQDLIEKGTIPGGWYAIVHCQGDLPKVAQAWDFLYKSWLPQSGYVPRHFPAVEEFLKGPEEIGWESFDLLCKVPIEKINNEP